jgi:hypothetical protein
MRSSASRARWVSGSFAVIGLNVQRRTATGQKRPEPARLQEEARPKTVLRAMNDSEVTILSAQVPTHLRNDLHRLAQENDRR